LFSFDLLMPSLKKEIRYAKTSFSQILYGIILVGLVFSGLVFAIFLRTAGFNGTIISFSGITIEILGIILSYLLLRRYVIPRDEGSNKPIQKEK